MTVKADEHRMTKASCTEKAKCEVCGYEEGEALGHDFGEWEVTKKSTIAEKGEETRSCVRCAYKEVRETERLNQTAEASKNKIEKIEAGRRYLVNEKIVFRAVGDGMGNGNPISGDTRFLPVKWRIGLQNTWKEFSGEAEFKIEKAGNYRINVLYQEQIFKDGKWASTENTDIKEVKFRIGAADEKKEEVKRAVKTGDKETGALYIGAAVIAVAVLAAIAKMKRKTR